VRATHALLNQVLETLMLVRGDSNILSFYGFPCDGAIFTAG
jgi:hypothetical protein